MNSIRSARWHSLLLTTVLSLCFGASSLLVHGELPVDEARQKLHSGAIIVDVRTVKEFKEKNLAGAVNVPLDTLKTDISTHVTNKSQTILLHCRSGRRSAMAETELRSLGYTNAFNIGSIEQAEKVIGKTAP